MKRLARFSFQICLAALLLSVTLSLLTFPVLGQSSNTTEITAEIKDQTDSPIRIMLNSLSARSDAHVQINFSAQNLSEKRVKAYVIAHGSGDGWIEASKSFEDYLMPNELRSSGYRYETSKLRKRYKFNMAVDFVLFHDGTIWGPDSIGQSESLKGFYEGRQIAHEQVAKLLSEGDSPVFADLLEGDMSKLEPPSVKKDKSSKWKSGYRFGFRSARRSLQSVYKIGGIAAVELRLMDTK